MTESEWYKNFCSWELTYNPIKDLERVVVFLSGLEEIQVKDYFLWKTFNY